MEQREAENIYLYKMVKLFLLINIIICVVNMTGLGFFFLIPNFFFLFLFDFFFLFFVYSSIKMEKQFFLNRLRKFLTVWGLFVLVHLCLGVGAIYIGISNAINFLMVLFMCFAIYNIALLEKRCHKCITMAMLFGCGAICFFVIVSIMNSLFWDTFGEIIGNIIRLLFNAILN